MLWQGSIAPDLDPVIIAAVLGIGKSVTKQPSPAKTVHEYAAALEGTLVHDAGCVTVGVGGGVCPVEHSQVVMLLTSQLVSAIKLPLSHVHGARIGPSMDLEYIIIS